MEPGLTPDPRFRIRQLLPALLYLPPSMAVACAKNSAPIPRPPIPFLAPRVARACCHDPDHHTRRLRELRFKKGWSQETLAAQAGLHRTYISGIERAERNIGLDNVEKLADAFGISVDELLCAYEGHQAR